MVCLSLLFLLKKVEENQGGRTSLVTLGMYGKWMTSHPGDPSRLPTTHVLGRPRTSESPTPVPKRLSSFLSEVVGVLVDGDYCGVPTKRDHRKTRELK